MVKEFVKKVFRLEEPSIEFDKALVPRLVKSKRIGSTGTEIYSGYFAEEYLEKLRGNKLAKEFDKIRRSDAQARMLLLSVKNPICGAGWEIEPASDSPEDQKIANLIEHILFHDCGKPFPKTIREALSCIDFGHGIMEKTFKTVFNHPEFGTYHGIQSLDLISAKTIETWLLEEGKLTGIRQLSNGDNRSDTIIPAEYLMVFNLEMEGTNFEGISWLRACYGNWFRKNLYQKLNAIGIEKFAVGTPTVEFPQGSQNDEQMDNIIEALEVYTSGEANYITLPSGYLLKIEHNAYDPEKVESSIDKEDARMAKAFLANFLELGMSGTGAYALSNDLSDFFLSGLTHIADEIANVFNTDLIPELCKLNVGPLHKYPKLKHTGISDKAGQELATIVTMYAEKNIITPDDALEDHLRKRHGLPKRSGIGVRKATPEPAFGFSSSLSERIRKRLYG